MFETLLTLSIESQLLTKSLKININTDSVETVTRSSSNQDEVIQLASNPKEIRERIQERNRRRAESVRKRRLNK